MSNAVELSIAGRLKLDGSALLVPALHCEPLPIHAIAPAPCTRGCPAGINVKAYVSLIAERRFAEALEVIRQRCPLPGICGRICHHPCEAACRRANTDEAIAIRELKRFVADLDLVQPAPSPLRAPERGAKVAIIGSGPAGLTAAYDLSLAGYPVTVFEAEDEPGGMLRHGITAYRLPREILDAEIQVLLSAGISLRTGCRLGVDLELKDLFEQGYRAVLVAVGAQRGRRLGIPGERACSEVEDAISFLRRVNQGDRTPVRGRVLVIGGGSTAIEAARAALRLGAESVEILYRRFRSEMLAAEEEIEAAEAEGVRLRFLTAPVRVLLGKRRLKGLECIQVGLGEPDASGRQRPLTIPGSEFVVEADRVIAAVGQESDFGCLPAPVRRRVTRKGRFRVDSNSSMTSTPGLFAAGDAVTGPATVIEAVAAGHRSARAIRHYLEGQPAATSEHDANGWTPTEYGLPDSASIEATRLRPELVRPRSGHEFSEVEQAFTVDDAVAEARRCLRCGPCGECRICASSCVRRHIMMRVAGGTDGPSALLRVPSSISLSLGTQRPAPGYLLSKATPGTLLATDLVGGIPIEVLPLRVHVEEQRCRGCSRCLEVCSFQALALRDPGAADTTVRLEAALCRGCNLCTAVCPTDAVVATALSPEWWGSRLQDLFIRVPLATASNGPFVVLACQRRAGAFEQGREQHGVQIEVIRFRCVGQLDAGMLLELCRHGAQQILVAGCQSSRCRFLNGSRLAAQQIQRAQRMLLQLGWDPNCIRADWSGQLADDPLERPVARWLVDPLALQPEALAAKGGRV